MLIQTEPNGFLMVRYKFYFNQQHADPEDAWVLAYLHEHGLEPRRRLQEEHDGVAYQVLHFGQCYLGRHLSTIGALYCRGIEHTVLAHHICQLLEGTDDLVIGPAVAALDADQRGTIAADLAAQLHAQARFEPSDDQEIRVEVDTAAVLDAFRAR